MSSTSIPGETTIVTCPDCGAKNRVDLRRVGRMQPKCARCGARLEAGGGDGNDPGHPVTVTDATLASVLASAGHRPVLVDCWAPWCGPCRMLAPTIDQLAVESRGRYVVAKLNTDENPRTAGEQDISSIPTLLIFKNGRVVDRIVGLQPKQALASRLMAHA